MLYDEVIINKWIIIVFIKKNLWGAGEIAQKLRVFGLLSEAKSLVPSTQLRQLLNVALALVFPLSFLGTTHKNTCVSTFSLSLPPFFPPSRPPSIYLSLSLSLSPPPLWW